MTPEHRRDVIIAGIVIAVLTIAGIIGFVAWRDQMEQNITAQATAKAKDDAIKQLQQQNQDRDKQIEQTRDELKDAISKLESARLNKQLSPSDIAAIVQAYLQNVPKPQEGTVTVETPKGPQAVEIPSLPPGIIALKQLEWQDFTVRCAECEATKDSLMKENALQQEQIASANKQIELANEKAHQWEIAARGGTKWDKFRKYAAITFGCTVGGVGGVYATHGQPVHTIAGVTALTTVAGCLTGVMSR